MFRSKPADSLQAAWIQDLTGCILKNEVEDDIGIVFARHGDQFVVRHGGKVEENAGESLGEQVKKLHCDRGGQETKKTDAAVAKRMRGVQIMAQRSKLI